MAAEGKEKLVKEEITTMYSHVSTHWINLQIERLTFSVKANKEFCDIYDINNEVRQETVLGPELYTKYLCDIPASDGVMLVSYADDPVIIVMNESSTVASFCCYVNSISLSASFRDSQSAKTP